MDNVFGPCCGELFCISTCQFKQAELQAFNQTARCWSTSAWQELNQFSNDCFHSLCIFAQRVELFLPEVGGPYEMGRTHDGLTDQ
ncbi:hypothetical protein D3C84_758210 [compost metagenome]